MLLDKLRTIWEYIKNNNVSGDLKGRYLQLLQTLKWRQWPGITWHKKVMDKLLEYRKTNPLVRPVGEKPVSDWAGVQAEADRMYAKDENKNTQAPDLEQMQKDYRQKALNQF